MKKNIVIVILLLLVIGLAGYIGYDKFLKDGKSNADNTTPTEKQEENIPEELNINNKREIQSLELLHAGGTVLVSKEGNAYIQFYNNEGWMDEYSKETIKNSIGNLEKQYKEYEINGYSASCGDESENNSTFKGIKLPVENVVAAYEAYSGQGDYQGTYLYFIKTDGTISGFDMGMTIYETNGQINFQNNIDNLTNIVTIVQSETTNGCSGAYEVMAIEKDGTQHILNNN